jgi:hypothetical protein
MPNSGKLVKQIDMGKTEKVPKTIRICGGKRREGKLQLFAGARLATIPFVFAQVTAS